ncbi:MAG: DMT family transporter [Verrucomicrobia bacterium]|nr:DMT family transporter [Verrucomicrobiota bacterium]
MTASSRSRSFIFINYLLLFGAGFIWGSQYILTKFALVSFSTTTIAGGRIGIGALLLTFLLKTGIEPLEQSKTFFWKSLPDFLLIGLLEATLPCVLIAWAQLRLASSVTAVLIGTVPLFATILEALFVPGSTISLKKGSGIFLGFVGVTVLIAPNFHEASLSPTHGSSVVLPVLAGLISALCFALAMLLIKIRLDTRFGPIRSAQGILTGAAITILPWACWISKPWKITAFHPTCSAVIALIALGIFCGGLVYTLFIVLINRAGPSFASTCNYLVPPTGAFLGIAFCGEKLTSPLLYSLVLILFSLWLFSGTKKSAH